MVIYLNIHQHEISDYVGTPQLPFKIPHITTNRDHNALNRGTLGGLGVGPYFGLAVLWGSRDPFAPSPANVASGVLVTVLRIQHLALGVLVRAILWWAV